MERRKGFTLVELLIVVAMIAVLALLLIPSLTRARVFAEQQSAKAFAHNVYKASFAYVAETMGNTVVEDSDCSDGYAAGNYVVGDPGVAVTACTVTDTDDNGVPEIFVRDRHGGTYRF